MGGCILYNGWLIKTQLHVLEWNETLSTDRDQCSTKSRKLESIYIDLKRELKKYQCKLLKNLRQHFVQCSEDTKEKNVQFCLLNSCQSSKKLRFEIPFFLSLLSIHILVKNEKLSFKMTPKSEKEDLKEIWISFIGGQNIWSSEFDICENENENENDCNFHCSRFMQKTEQTMNALSGKISSLID